MAAYRTPPSSAASSRTPAHHLKGTRQTAAGLDGEAAAGASQAADVEVEAEAEVGAEAVAAVAIAGGDGISDLGGRGEMRGEACWSELVRQARQQLAAFCF